MKLSHELAKLFETELGKDLLKEVENDTYLPHEAFDSCEARAKALLNNAVDKVTKVLTLAIIEHREREHEETKTIERGIAEVQMSIEDIEVATRGWWRD